MADIEEAIVQIRDGKNVTINMAELTPEEKWRLEHIKMHEQHKGHDAMHAEMILILVVTLIVAQIVLVEWKKRHYRSYQFVTLMGMWVIPLGLCLKNQWWRFVFSWLVFSCITGLVVRKAIEKPIKGTTPRLVYKWFYFLYKLSYALGIIGYVVMMATFFGFNLLFSTKPHVWMDFGLLFLFYGLYYGVLGRDIAEICADKMASHIGYYTAHGMPTRQLDSGVCAVCGNRLLVSESEEGVLENTYKLSCNYDEHLPAWKKKMERMMKVLKQTFENIEGASKPYDLAQGAEEILLEPCVLLSLPSSSSLLQTWLACAVIEIQKVECDSVELRHWPLPPQLEAVTRELLSLIAYTKERVLLAMSLFVMYVTNYVDKMYDAELLSVLLEKALLPSTSGLQFICSGKASKAVAQIKQLAFRESRNIKDCVSVPLESYNTAETLADVHHNFFWHLCYWCNPTSLLEPFPAVSLMSTDVHGLVSELRRNVVPPADYPATYTVNALGHDEMAFWAEWFSKSQGGDFQDLRSQVDKRLNQIKKVMMHVANLGYVTQDAVNKIQFNINIGTLRELAELEMDTQHNENLTLPQQAVLYACMYIQLNETLRGIDVDQQKSSVLGWLVRLSGELSEREQLMRLAATIAHYSSKTPVLPGLEAPGKNITADQIIQEIKSVSREPVRDLKWLWSQLPSEWQLPVKTTEQEPLIEKGLSTVVESLENRLGRLLLTSAREGLRLSDVFDQRLEMQYMMPCYISALLEVGANPSHQDQAQNLVGLLHCLLSYYETQLTAWVKGSPNHSMNRRNIMHMKSAYEIMTDEDFKFNNSVYVGQHVMELITQRMQAFIGLGQRDLEGLPGFCEVVGAMKQWPVIQSCKELNEQYTEVEVFSCFAWKNFAIPHCLTLLQQCQNAWPIEPPKNPKLAQLLYVTELMSQIEVLSCAAFHRDFLLQFQLQMGSAEFHEFIDKMNHVLVWRREFLARVVSAEMQQAGDLDRCVAKGHSLTKDMWRAIRSLRRKIKIVHPMDFPPTGHPTLEEAVSNFIKGNIKETDDAISHPEFYLAKEAKKSNSTPSASSSKTQRKVPCPKPGSNASKPPTTRPQADSFDPKVKWCRKCLKVQVGSNTFIRCQQCVDENYPDVNFFCTEKCKDEWMKEEHFAEHLEYELGLSPLCQTK